MVDLQVRDMFLKVAKHDDDITQLGNTVSDTTSLEYHKQSLLLACKECNIECIRQMIIQLRPELAKPLDEQGNTVLHIVVAGKGSLSVIEALIYQNPHLCTLQNNEGTTPFHIAAKQGWAEILRVLIESCGAASLGLVNSQRQTALHLALQENQLGCFDVMMVELFKGAGEGSLGVLNSTDHLGNTVLHIASSKKQTRIIGYLMEDNPQGSRLVEVDIKNCKGFTALEIHDLNLNKHRNRRVRKLLGAEDVMAYTSMEVSQSRMTTVMTSKATIVGVLVGNVVLSFKLLSYFPVLYNEVVYNQPVDPNAITPLLSVMKLPFAFYFLTCTSLVLVVAVFMILVLLWSVDMPFSFYCRAGFVFLGITTLLIFGLTVKEIVPQFSITILGFHPIPSLWFLGLYVAALLITFAAFTFTVKQVPWMASMVCWQAGCIYMKISAMTRSKEFHIVVLTLLT